MGAVFHWSPGPRMVIFALVFETICAEKDIRSHRAICRGRTERATRSLMEWIPDAVPVPRSAPADGVQRHVEGCLRCGSRRVH